MELSKSELEEMIDRIATKAAQKATKGFNQEFTEHTKQIDVRFEQFAKSSDQKTQVWQQNSDVKFEQYSRRLDKKIAKWQSDSDAKMAKWKQESEERLQRYIGAIKEDFDSKFEIVMEALQPLGDMAERLTRVEETVNDMKPKVDATFEAVGVLIEDVTILKETVKIHDQKLASLV